MADGIDSLYKTSIFSNDNKLSSLSNTIYFKIKANLIENLGSWFFLKYDLSTKTSTQYMIEIISNIISFSQMVTILWYPEMEIKNWNSYFGWWKVLGYFSFDTIFAALNVYQIAFYAFISQILLYTSAIIVFSFFNSLFNQSNWKLFKLFLTFPTHILDIISTIGFIPTNLILIVTIKYSLFSHSNIDEYKNLTQKDVDVGAVGIFLGIFSLIQLFCLCVFRELFTADVRHSFAWNNIKSRSNSSFNVLLMIYKQLFIFMHVSMSSKKVWYYAIIMTFSGILALKVWKSEPYYNLITNVIQVSMMLGVMGISFNFLVGIWMDNSGIIALLSICVVPLALGIIFYWMHKFSLKQSYKGTYLDEYTFELRLRKQLTSKNFKNFLQIYNKFSEIHKISQISKDKLLVVWEVNYCLFSAEDFSLAKIKLARMSQVHNSFEGEVQEQRIYQWFKINEKSISDENDFLSYLNELELAKKDDKALCKFLLDLWKEASIEKPKISKLEYLVKNSASLIKSVNSIYTKLLKEKHPKSYEIYGSLLQNILYDFSRGKIILDKASQNSIIQEPKKIEKIENFEEGNGNILISANKDSFGVIVYINEIAAQMLKGTVTNILENNIIQYIPSPYNENHLEIMKKFVDNCTGPEIFKNYSWFTMDCQGYLNESYTLIKLTALREDLFFMVSMKPISSSHQVALISEDGTIYCHSDLFANALDLPNQFINYQNILSYIPKFFELELFEPELIVGKQAIAVVHGIKYFKKSEVHYAILITDKSEITEWLQKSTYEQREFFGQLTNRSIINEPKQNDTKIPTDHDDDRVYKRKSNASITTFIDDVEDSNNLEKCRHKFEELGSNISFQVSSYNFINSKEKSIINQSEQSLRKFKLVLFFSIISVLITNVAIIIYIADAVNHSRSINTFNDLGIILYRIASAAENSRLIDLAISYNHTEVSYYTSMLEQTRSDLLTYQSTLYKHYEDWSYCDSSKIIMLDIIPIWDFNNNEEPRRIFMNLYDALSEFIGHINSMIGNVKNSENYTNDLQFLVANGLGEAFYMSNSSLNGLVNCEIDRISTIGTFTIVLDVIGASILGICMAFLVFYILFISKKYNNLWNFIREKIYACYYELIKNCKDRLALVHNEELEEVDIPLRKKYKRISINIRMRYITRLALFISLTGIYYSLVHGIMYPDVEEYLKKRPQIMYIYVQRRAIIPKIGFFAREAALDDQEKQLKQLIPKSLSFPNANNELAEAITIFMKCTHSFMWNRKYLPAMMRTSLFEHGSSPIYQSNLGSIWWTNLLMFEASALQKYDSEKMSQLWILTRRYTELQLMMARVFSVIDEGSKEMISDRLSDIVNTAIIYIVLSVFLYLLYFLPYLSREISKLNRLKVILSIIPIKGKANEST
ncbi:unnamed protein product [Blepharisma stoltei]|uniref:TmcB/TmcC TPR repeats domain-containing protein n=1 Tax=Blepharisma stoltei TaxID=1481888 RepID=A0AAU9JNG5_9CILI|nr:unnamed protein product [Blepharisma stoltei]